jgi:hypothetical protein
MEKLLPKNFQASALAVYQKVRRLKIYININCKKTITAGHLVGNVGTLKTVGISS